VYDNQFPNNQMINKEINKKKKKRARTETSNLNSGVQHEVGTNWESTVYSYAFNKKTVKIFLVHSKDQIYKKKMKKEKKKKHNQFSSFRSSGIPVLRARDKKFPELLKVGAQNLDLLSLCNPLLLCQQLEEEER